MTHPVHMSNVSVVWCFAFTILYGRFTAAQNPIPECIPVVSQREYTSLLARKFIDHDGGPKKGEIAFSLFSNASPSELLLLRFNDDTGLSLTAQWTTMRIQMFSRLVSTNKSAAAVHVPDAVSREFLAFLEGRLDVPAPDGWARVLRKSRFTRDGIFLFPVATYVFHNRHSENSQSDSEAEDFIRSLESGRITHPRLMVDLNRNPPQFRISGGLEPFEGSNATITIPEQLRKVVVETGGESAAERISGISIGGKAFVVIESPDGQDLGTIYCLEEKDPKLGAKILWKSSMDARWRFRTSGSSIWFTELRSDGSHVFLFHASRDSVGVEALCMADGRRVFSFNSRLPDNPVRSFIEK